MTHCNRLLWVLQSNSPFLHPISKLDWCNGQTVISEKFTGFTKILLLAKISSISVLTPENCKKRLWLLTSLLHDDRDTDWVDWCLARSSAPQTPPTISSKEQDILFLLELKQPLSLSVYSSHRRLLRFCFLFTFVNRSHCFSVGKLYRFFRSIRFSSYGLCLWNFVKSISLLYRFRSRWQYICLNFICEAEWIVCWSRYVTDYHMSRRVTGTCEKLIKIRQIPSVTCRFVGTLFVWDVKKKPKLGSK